MIRKALLFTSIAMIFGVCPARAQDEKAEGWESPDGSSKSYQELTHEAEAALERRDWGNCTKYFELARDMKPDDSYAYLGTGNCAWNEGQYIIVIENLERGLQLISKLDSDTAPPEAVIARASQLLEKARKMVGRFRIKLVPESAIATISDERINLDPDGYFWLDPGQHFVKIAAEGYQTKDEQLEVVPGDDRVLKYVLEQNIAIKTEITPPPSNDESEFPVVPVVVTSVGGAMLIGAAVTGLMALSEEGKLEDECQDNLCDPSLKSTKDSAETLGIVTDVLWIAGAVTAGTGIALFFLLPQQESERATINASFGTSHIRVNVTGRF